jgi:hypothetical protein
VGVPVSGFGLGVGKRGTWVGWQVRGSGCDVGGEPAPLQYH